MSSPDVLRQKALAAHARGVAAEERGAVREACAQYGVAAEALFLAARASGSTPRVRELLLEKAGSVLSRAESLKAAADQEAKQDDDGAAGGGSGSSGSASARESGRSAQDEALARALESTVTVECPDVSWDDVAGLEEAKRTLRQAVELPLKAGQLFSSGRLSRWRGILLYGPPGTGKTQLARAVASTARSTFITASAADLTSKWVGDAEKSVRALFRLARERGPTVVFLDEVDAICGQRAEGENDASLRMKTELLAELDGVGSGDDKANNVVVIGATNRPWSLDAAVLRRFEKKIMIDLPPTAARRQLLALHLSKIPHSLTEADLDAVALETDGWSGAELRALVKEAAFRGLEALSDATHFTRTSLDGVLLRDDDDDDAATTTTELTFCVTPSSPDAPGAIEIDLDGVDARGWMPRLRLPPVSAADMRAALAGTKGGAAALNRKDATALEEFTEAIGTLGA